MKPKDGYKMTDAEVWDAIGNFTQFAAQIGGALTRRASEPNFGNAERMASTVVVAAHAALSPAAVFIQLRQGKWPSTTNVTVAPPKD